MLTAVAFLDCLGPSVVSARQGLAMAFGIGELVPGSHNITDHFSSH